MICPNCKKEIEPVEEFTSTVNVVKDKEGRVKTWTEETRDIDDILVSKRTDEYKYFSETGNVDTINQKVFDGEGSLRSEKTVRHFEDGTKPIMITLLANSDS